jgi:hypothetical protein
VVINTAKREDFFAMRLIGVLGIFLLVNAVALFCVFNPWIKDWAAQGIVLLVLEGIFLVLIGVPVFLYHFIGKKKTFRQSLSDSVESVLNFLVGWV